jgi:hypothetical protein
MEIDGSEGDPARQAKQPAMMENNTSKTNEDVCLCSFNIYLMIN